MFCTIFPPNPFNKVQNGNYDDRTSDSFGGGGIYVGTASSFHPGGVNVAFVDGSVRFLKDTIDSWTNDPKTGVTSA